MKFNSGDSLGEGYRKRSLIVEMAQEILVRDGNLDIATVESQSDPLPVMAAGPANLRAGMGQLANSYRSLVHAESLRRDTCVPAQRARVQDACDISRDSRIPVVAVDLSNGVGSASDMLQECVFGEAQTASTTNTRNSPTAASAHPLPDFEPGVPYEAEDGSIYIHVTDRTQLRDVLTGLMPQANSTQSANRMVRLVR